MSPLDSLATEEFEGAGWAAEQAGDARACYECTLVERARRIVAGDSGEAPTREHLRVLLTWLDGRPPRGVPPPWPETASGRPF